MRKILKNDKIGQKKFYNTLMRMPSEKIQDYLISCCDSVNNVPFLLEFGRNLYINIYYHLNGDQHGQHNLGVIFLSLNEQDQEGKKMIKRMYRFTRFSPINSKTLEILEYFSTLYNTDTVNILGNTGILLQLSNELDNYRGHFQ
jgi:hypothetical protein